jgi:hypothetical protein
MYIAYCIPYTYSRLLVDIEELQTQYEKSRILTVGSNGRSLMGLNIPILKITDPNILDRGKRVILVTGRIHPGESNGSIVLWGMVRQLCSKEAYQLRKRYKFSNSVWSF